MQVVLKEVDFTPNDLDMLLMEPREEGALIREDGLIGAMDLIEHVVGKLIEAIFVPKIPPSSREQVERVR